MTILERAACKCADGMGTVAAVIAVPIISYTAAHFFGEASITLHLSIAALSASSLILIASRRSERAIQLKLDELVHAVDKADDSVAEIETRI